MKTSKNPARLGHKRTLLAALTAAGLACGAGVAVVGLAGNAQAAFPNGCTPAADWGTARKQPASAVVDLVNLHRGALGLSRLRVSATLTASAVWKARHMARYGYFGHDDPAPPVARTVFERIAACGYRGSQVGENIAGGYRTPQAAMQAWLLSPGHRANLEAPHWTSIGVGVAQGASGILYWVQDFGTDAGTSAANHTPVAHLDRRSVHDGHQIVIDVLRNDRDPDGDPLTVVSVPKLPHHGWVWSQPGNRFLYQPAGNFVGRDRFRYQVTDGKGAYSSAVVIVRVKK